MLKIISCIFISTLCSSLALGARTIDADAVRSSDRTKTWTMPGITDTLATAIEVRSAPEISNLGLSASVSSNALTISLKQADGSTAPAATGPVKVGFRSSTATAGSFSTVSVTAATSVVVSSGSTLGSISGVAHYYYVYAINNAGTLELATSMSIFEDGSLVSTTAEGGAGAADSNAVMYSTTARTNVPSRMIGRILITEATAGTWASAPTEVSAWPFEIIKPRASYWTGAGQSVANNTGTIVDYGTLIEDNCGCVTTGSSWKFTVPVAGLYWIHATIAWDNDITWNGGTEIGINIYVNTTETISTYDRIPLNYTYSRHHSVVSGLIKAVKGDYFSIIVLQNIGTSKSLYPRKENNRVDIVYMGK